MLSPGPLGWAGTPGHLVLHLPSHTLIQQRGIASSTRRLSGLWLNGMSKRDQITAIFILEKEVIEEVSNQSVNSGGGVSCEGLNRGGGQRETRVGRQVLFWRWENAGASW